MNDLERRMKRQYEDRTRYYLPRRTYTIVRVDGKSFHTYTKQLKRPFDVVLQQYMDWTMLELCRQMTGAKFGFVQSDEISILLTDFEKPTTDAWFDGNLQKICSVSASIATQVFNKGDGKDWRQLPNTAQFDSRVFTIPDWVEVENYFISRQNDATRNSIQMAAQSVYSHKALLNKKIGDLQDMLMEKGINWNNYPARFKRGGACIYRSTQENPEAARWQVDPETPIFTKDREYLSKNVPRLWQETVSV